MRTSDEMLEDLEKLMEESSLFKKVCILENEPSDPFSLENIPDLTKFPACVLAAGKRISGNGGFTSSTEIRIFVISDWYGDESNAGEKNEILKKTLFLLQDQGTCTPFCLNGVYYLPESMEIVFPDHNHITSKIVLTAKTTEF